MSYILDALRKADAERERDPARGIHAQPMVQPAPARRAIPLWLGAAALVVLGGAAAYGWLQRTPTAPMPAPAPVVVAPAVEAAPPVVAPAVLAVAEVVMPPAPPSPMPERAPARPVAAAAVPQPAAAPPPSAAASSSAPAAPATERVLAVAELPPEVQRELPRLQISGGVHSDNAAQRMLIVGGQVVTEGTEIAPGVVLEQIRARTAVLKFRGYRYSVAY